MPTLTVDCASATGVRQGDTVDGLDKVVSRNSPEREELVKHVAALDKRAKGIRRVDVSRLTHWLSRHRMPSNMCHLVPIYGPLRCEPAK